MHSTVFSNYWLWWGCNSWLLDRESVSSFVIRRNKSWGWLCGRSEWMFHLLGRAWLGLGILLLLVFCVFLCWVIRWWVRLLLFCLFIFFIGVELSLLFLWSCVRGQGLVLFLAIRVLRFPFLGTWLVLLCCGGANRPADSWSHWRFCRARQCFLCSSVTAIVWRRCSSIHTFRGFTYLCRDGQFRRRVSFWPQKSSGLAWWICVQCAKQYIRRRYICRQSSNRIWRVRRAGCRTHGSCESTFCDRPVVAL